MHARKDVEKLEKMQRRLTKMLECKLYEEKLNELVIFSLVKRGLRRDMIAVFICFERS